jgi:hypothetical protein
MCRPEGRRLGLEPSREASLLHFRYNEIHEAVNSRETEKARSASDRGRPALWCPNPRHSYILAIDRWAAENNLPSRSDAMRRLLELGLSFSKTAPKVKH